MADHNKEFLQKLLVTFRVEAQEHVQDTVASLVLLEQAGPDARKGLVERILKRLHTLKGAARAVTLTELEMLCHTMESVFSELHKSPQALLPEQFDLAHQAGTMMQALVENPSGRVRNQAASLAARLEQLAELLAQPAHDTLEATATPTAFTPPEEIGQAVEAREPSSSEMIRVQSKYLDVIRYQAEALLSVELNLQHHLNDLLSLVDDIAMQREETRIAEAPSGAAMRARRSGTRMRPHDAQVRGADAEQFNSQLELRCRRLAESMGRTRRNFSVMRSKLMDATLEVALVPFSLVLQQLPGLVRNLARSQDKEAVLAIEGDGVQIDRRILDTVREALIHLVTNAVDHGIETTEQRQAKGKPPAGVVRVSIAQLGGNRVSVLVRDDGAGIDIGQVAAAAAQAQHLDAAQIAAFGNQQKLNLVLLAGVSTNANVTQTSGRGVGLAIVAERVAAVGGELSIENAPGAGCAFKLVLPMRLATLRGLVLRISGMQYVLPLTGLESVRALRDGDIQTVEGRETLLAGGRVVPAVRLGSLLGLARRGNTGMAEESVAVIVRMADTVLALLADEILAEQEVLPKSLGKQLRRVRYISGATMLGDGSLVAILGLDDIVKYGLSHAGATLQADSVGADEGRMKRVLVAEDSITSRLLLKHILESAGYQVDTAVDGLDALSKLRHEDFSLLVSDIEMPRMDGLALTERLRADPKTENLPIVLVTSLQSPAEKERGLHAGADAYVVKGAFDQDGLLSTIRRLI
ncbi:CheA signal transduction histidine kinase [Paucimonas lemoignei]|uniref:Chemotaxis protein CheA n=1 Tax=Paucimonas lemoignei TaxID=29443 RepID=A0A4R3HYN8_PAULE|nr:response regulator [Paucimonas lemoignei]TCS38456.1 CheA signal transduction histidine kinase [Paucimonas lemoignei]